MPPQVNANITVTTRKSPLKTRATNKMINPERFVCAYLVNKKETTRNVLILKLRSLFD